MTRPVTPPRQSSPQAPQDREIIGILQAHYQAMQSMRRGVCLLNAGQFDKALAAFLLAERLGSTDRSLPAYLASCFLAQEKPADAVCALSAAATGDAEQPAWRIRYSLALAAADRTEDAIGVLRDAIRRHPDCAELHFQLGTLLASAERYEEAELRFVQAVTIDRDHADALMNLGLCCGLRGALAEALNHLQRAQSRRPQDPRIGVMMARAAQALQQEGLCVQVRAEMPVADPLADTAGIEELSRVIEAEPDFVDAFLLITPGEVDEQVFAVLLKTLGTALARQPEHAELHFHCGRVLARLGRRDAAISANERAVKLDPTSTRALIELGRLYHETDRGADATTRLEQAVAAGADYADVHFLLGNLYRDGGQLGRARSAYHRALLINDRYEAARTALDLLPA